MLKLTKKEEAWLARFRKTMAAAPVSLGEKISSFTIGDNDITLYDAEKFKSYFELNNENDEYHCTLVDMSGSKLEKIYFPFNIESTAG